MSAEIMTPIQFADVMEHELDCLRGSAHLLQVFAEARDEDDECRCALGLLADAVFTSADKVQTAFTELERTQAATIAKGA